MLKANDVGKAQKQGWRGPAAAPDLACAVVLHEAGQLDEAEVIYRAVLARAPRSADALQFLGVIAHQRGDDRKAVALLKKALGFEPGNTSCHNNLGSIYDSIGETRKAAFHFARAAGAAAPSAQALANLGTLRRRAGDRKGAAECFERALVLEPGAPEALGALAGLRIETREFAAAEALLRKLIEIRPDDLPTLNNLAYVVQQQGRHEESGALFGRALARAGHSLEIGHNLRLNLILQGKGQEAMRLLIEELAARPEAWSAEVGLAINLAGGGHLDAALAILRGVLEALPEHAEAWSGVGLVYLHFGRLVEAVATLERSLALAPDMPAAHNALGGAYQLCHQSERAVPEYKAAIRLKPDFIDPYVNICRALRTLGEHDQASIYGRLVREHPGYEHRFFPNMIQLLRGTCDFEGLAALGDVWDGCDRLPENVLPALFLDLLVFARTPADNARFFALVRRWAAWREAEAARAAALSHDTAPGQGRIRVGFLSSDLRTHSVARFLVPLMRGYDRGRFELYCYTSVRDPGDPVQELLKGLVDRFHFVDNRGPREIAQVIRDDGIDILFDLNGFTEHTMIEALAYRPAPVQISWLGYPFTCGLSTIDHVVMDRFVMPEGGRYLTEEPIVMPGAWVCFGNFADVAVEPGPPVDRTGRFTFGTLNNPYKYTPHMIANWARVLKAVPDSRFLIVRPEARSAVICRNLAEEFARHGVSSDRLFLLDNRAGGRNHLAYYNEIDASLDTFPLTGGTTTCEATWMGVPVISLAGPAFHQRISRSVLMQCGFDDLCVTDDDAFVARAVEVAEDTARLRAWRSEMRATMAASPLCDQNRFVHQFQEMLEQVAAHHGLR